MKATIKVRKLELRDRPSISGLDVGDLFYGDVVYGDIRNGWIGFQRVHRYNGQVEPLSGYCSASFQHVILDDKPEPEYRVVKHVVVVYDNGDVVTDETRALDAVKRALEALVKSTR